MLQCDLGQPFTPSYSHLKTSPFEAAEAIGCCIAGRYGDEFGEVQLRASESEAEFYNVWYLFGCIRGDGLSCVVAHPIEQRAVMADALDKLFEEHGTDRLATIIERMASIVRSGNSETDYERTLSSIENSFLENKADCYAVLLKLALANRTQFGRYLRIMTGPPRQWIFQAALLDKSGLV